ncbi:zinc-dependent alcohol dehydrogenase family protein [Fodinibacter luteus]|uniref:Zinc-dependent alcohol dehydrogenase family protein n=1 Tax=Fodinibacter luteus TaxID=552064 RepID=A0ABP8K1Y8_9MICO
MRAVVYDGPRSFAVREVPTPEPTAGQVRVRVVQTGVCGTDLHLHEGRFMAAYPMVPGHEVVGVVDALGDGVDGVEGVAGVAVGELVAVNPNAACGTCEYCREGRALLCDALTGIGSNLPGGFAEHVVAPAAQVFSVEGLDVDTAVLTEPTSCAAHAVDVIAPRHGSTALVIGAGPTGVLLAQLLRGSGASKVTVAAPTAFKLERATALGVDATYLMDRGDLAGDVQALLRRSGGSGYDVVVDATGAAVVAEVLVPLTRSGGTAVFYGVTDEEDRVAVSPYDVFRRELTIKGSFAEISSFPAAIAAMRSGRVRTDGLVTHRFGLDDYGLALEALRSDRTAHKVVVVP